MSTTPAKAARSSRRCHQQMSHTPPTLAPAPVERGSVCHRPGCGETALAESPRGFCGGCETAYGDRIALRDRIVDQIADTPGGRLYGVECRIAAE